MTLDQAGRGRPWMTIVAPPVEAHDLIEHVWIEDSAGINACCSGPWRIVPDGSAHVIFGTMQTERGLRCRLSVVGARTVHTDIDRAGRVLTVGARLAPGTLPSLFGLDARTLTDTSARMTDLCPRAGRDLMERMAHATSHVEMVAVIAAALMRLRRSRVDPCLDRVDHAVRCIDARGGNVSLRQIALDLGSSSRTLRSVFAERVGLSPKRYARVRRLHDAVRLALANGKRSLVRIASDMGYADQAHMSRDFRELLGQSPGAFLRRRGSP